MDKITLKDFYYAFDQMFYVPKDLTEEQKTQVLLIIKENSLDESHFSYIRHYLSEICDESELFHSLGEMYEKYDDIVLHNDYRCNGCEKHFYLMHDSDELICEHTYPFDPKESTCESILSLLSIKEK
jgi:hypothetical protein